MVEGAGIGYRHLINLGPPADLMRANKANPDWPAFLAAYLRYVEQNPSSGRGRWLSCAWRPTRATATGVCQSHIWWGITRTSYWPERYRGPGQAARVNREPSAAA